MSTSAERIIGKNETKLLWQFEAMDTFGFMEFMASHSLSSCDDVHNTTF